MNGLHDGRQRLANDRDTAGVNETKNDRRRKSDQDDEYRKITVGPHYDVSDAFFVPETAGAILCI